MEKKIVLIALLFGFISIVLGAFGAHALKKVLQTEQLNSFEVGVRYLMYHAIFLLFISNTSSLLSNQKSTIFYLTVLGVFLFSGSIFLLATSAISGINFKFLGPITPIGGLLLISAWGMSFYYIILKKG
jgi:uncharacterized membrane protein YgdD (TMEM256/DUF423 family)